MAWGPSNLYSRMSASRSVVIVTAPTGSTVTMNKNGYDEIRTVPEINGVWTFIGIPAGSWIIAAKKGNIRREVTKGIDKPDFYRFKISFNPLPVFHYTGQAKLTDDEFDSDYIDLDNPPQNWRYKMLTSGWLTVDEETNVDMYAVGGGAPGSGNKGGGGGYVSRRLGYNLMPGVRYYVTIGIGDGGYNNPGSGTTKISIGNSKTDFILSANGGEYGNVPGGGNGGGGKNGHGGYGGWNNSIADGEGPGPSYCEDTIEFYEDGRTYFAGGGAGLNGVPGLGGGGESYPSGKINGKPNTGGGGGAGGPGHSSGQGGTGILIIRNARGV